MKLTEDQLIILQDTLNERIKYKETYDEVYDHVLTALEQVDSNIPLGQAINTIMLNDFGGFKGLKKIERRRWWMVILQMAKKQLWYLIDYLKFPLLPTTLIIYALIYYCVVELQFNLVGYMFIYSASMYMIPLCSTYWYLKSGHRFKNIKKSIKKHPLAIVSQAPFYIFAGTFFILEVFFRQILKVGSILNYSQPSLAISLLLTLYIIYNISFFRLYKNEIVMPEIK
jgi:hypothetical protein